MSLLRPLTDFERRLIRSTDPLPAFNLKKPVTGYSPTNAAPGVRRTPRDQPFPMNVKKFLHILAAVFLLASPLRATVPSSTAWLQYVSPSNPAANPLAISFVFQSSTDLIVYDSKSSPPTVLVLNSDYSVQGGLGSTGTVTIIAGGQNGVQVGDVITITRNVPITQTTTFSVTGPLNPTMIMQALDKVTEIEQQQQVQINLALQFQPDETRSGVMALQARENMSPAFDSLGNLIWVTPGSGGGGGGGSGLSQTITQANAFVAGQPVTVNSSGTWVAATASSTLNGSNALGIVSSLNLSATQFTVVQNGPCTVSTGSFSAASIYYVPLAAGIVTSTPPSTFGQFVYPIATATSATVLNVSLSSPSIVGVPAGGANTQVQFNSSGAFAGSSNLTWNGTTFAASVANITLLGVGGIPLAAADLTTTGTPPPSAGNIFGIVDETNLKATAINQNLYGLVVQNAINTQTYTGQTYNGLYVSTPSLAGSGTVTGGYQLNLQAPAAGMTGGLYNAGSTVLGSTLGVTGISTFANGTAAAPSVVFTGAGTTGLYWGNPGIGFSVGGTSVGTMTSTGLNGMAIGATTQAAGSFTILSATASSTTTPFTVNGGSLTAGTFASNVTYNASGASIATSGTSDTTTGVRWQVGSVTLDLGTYASGSTYLQNRAIANYGVWYPILINPAGGNVTLGGSSSTVTVTNALSVSGTSTLTGNVGIGAASTTTSPLHISGLPTSSAGLVTGDVYSNAGILTIK